MDEIKKILQVMKAVRKRFVLFLVIVFIGTWVTAGINIFLLNPKYSSSVQMIVRADELDAQNSVNGINANVLLINTYKDLIKGEVVLDEVKKALREENFQVTNEEINKALEISQSANSQMFMIKATSDSPKHAALIVNTTARIFKEKAIDMLGVKKVTISSYGKENAKPTSPQIKLNLVLGLFVSVCLGGISCIVLDLLADKIKGKSDVEGLIGIPVLGIVTIVKDK